MANRYHSSMVRIDGQKLKKVLKEKGLAQTKLSEDLGFKDFYISNSIRRNSLPEAVIKDLQEFYDIMPYE